MAELAGITGKLGLDVARFTAGLGRAITGLSKYAQSVAGSSKVTSDFEGRALKRADFGLIRFMRNTGKAAGGADFLGDVVVGATGRFMRFGAILGVTTFKLGRFAAIAGVTAVSALPKLIAGLFTTSAAVARFSGATAVATATLGAFRAMLGRVATGIVRFGKMLALAATVGLTVLVVKAARAIDSTARLADRLNITTESLIGLRFAAKATGVASGSLDKALTVLTVRLGQARKGSGAAYEALRTLGLSANELVKIPLNEQLAQIAAGLDTLPSGADKAAVSLNLLSRVGLPLAHMLAQGEKGFAEFEKRAEQMGLTFTRFEAALVGNMMEPLRQLGGSFKVLGQTVAIALAPYIERLAEWFIEVTTSGDGLKNVLKKIGDIVKWLARGMANALQVMSIAWDTFQVGVMSAFEVIVTGVKWVFEALDWFDRKIAGGPGFEFVKDFGKFAEDLNTSNKKLLKDTIDAWNAPWASEAVDKFFTDIEEKARKAAENTANAGDAMGNYAADIEAAAKAAAKLADQQSRVLAIWEATRTPLERHNRTMWELYDLYNKMDKAGKWIMSEDIYIRAVNEAESRLAAAQRGHVKKLELADVGAPGAPAALARGSVGAYSAIAAFERGTGRRQIDLLADINNENREQTRKLGDLVQQGRRQTDRVVQIGA